MRAPYTRGEYPVTSMGIDSKGVRRGGCKRCDCKDFYSKSVKCRCGHAPTSHADLRTEGSSSHLEHVSNESRFNRPELPVDKPSYSGIVASSAPASVSEAKLIQKSKGKIFKSHERFKPFLRCSNRFQLRP